MGLALALVSSTAQGAPPEFDALAELPPLEAPGPVRDEAGAPVLHRDERLGVPTLVWVDRAPLPPARLQALRSLPPVQAALEQLEALAPLYGATSLNHVALRPVGTHVNTLGTTVVSLAQEVDGLPLFRGTLRLLLDADQRLVAVSGRLLARWGASEGVAKQFQLAPQDAVARAYADLTGEGLDATLLQPEQDPEGPYQRFGVAPYARPLPVALTRPARVRPLLFALPDALVPAFYVEVRTESKEGPLSYSYVLSATDGTLLLRHSLVAHADVTYGVWADSTPPFTPWPDPRGPAALPHPTGELGTFVSPPLAPQTVTLSSAPFLPNDAWLPAGATLLQGNNVEAFADVQSPEGLSSGDVWGRATPNDSFAYPHDFSRAPTWANERQATLAHLFFVTNWLHDWFYAAGFDEAAGNAQRNNLGRGGLGGDVLRAMQHELSWRNNAMMDVAADGESPTMWMFLWDAPLLVELTVSAPGNQDVPLMAQGAFFGPDAYDVSAELVQTVPASACSSLTNGAALMGKVAVVMGGSCPPGDKAHRARLAGATGVLVLESTSPSVEPLPADGTLTLPVARLASAETARLLPLLVPGASVRMRKEALPLRSSALDTTVVAHEWGHYISNRLIGDANGLTNAQGWAMGEGWGDFHSLLLAARAEHAAVPANANWRGVWPLARWTALAQLGPAAEYFGLRRVPYSVDRSKNALSFRHIRNGERLPTNHPMAGNSAGNAEVHNAGEVWATMLWEAYVSLLTAHPFEEAQRRMRDYLVAGYMLTPPAPTFLEARDALLAAALAHDAGDTLRMAQAFARRGAGLYAVAPERYSRSFNGLQESPLVTPVPVLAAAALREGGLPGCDPDGVLDEGEQGLLALTVRNDGNAPVAPLTVTVQARTAGVLLPQGGTWQLPAIAPRASATVEVPVQAAGLSSGPQPLLFEVVLSGESVPEGASPPSTLSLRGNGDWRPATSLREDVEAPQPLLPWTLPAGPSGSGWRVATLPDGNHTFAVAAPAFPSDLQLLSPPLDVTGELTVRFRHRFAFEVQSNVARDGGVVELSEDGGRTWKDVGSGYTRSISAVGSPLGGRSAYAGTSPGHPAFTPVELRLGSAYVGRTVQLRFRMGSDMAGASGGWEVDDIEVQGVRQPPFWGLGADTGVCGSGAPTAEAGADLAVDEGTQVTLTGRSSDPEGDGVALRWRQLSGPQALLHEMPGDTLTFVAPEVQRDERLTFELIASDGNASASDTVDVLVRQVNRPPQLTLPSTRTVKEGSQVVLSASVTDPDALDTVTVLWTQELGEPVVLTGAGTLKPTFVAPGVLDGETQLTFRLTVTDGVFSVGGTVDVVVQERNTPPTLRMLHAQPLVVTEGEEVELHALVTDADPKDEPALRAVWTQVSGTKAEVREGEGGRLYVTAPSLSGIPFAELVFSAVPFDGRDEGTPVTTSVTVRKLRRPPVVTVAPLTPADAGGTVVLQAEGSDPEGGTLTWQWTQTGGAGSGLQRSGARVELQAPSLAEDSVLTFQVTATSSASGLRTQAQVELQVRAAPAPVAPPERTAGCGCSGSAEAFSVLPLLLLAAGLRRRRVGR